MASKKVFHPALSGGKLNPFPIGAFLLLVLAVCVGLALSAGYIYFTLSRLRTEYLQNRANEIGLAIDAQARGPGRRNNPAFWQSLLDDNFNSFGASLAFVSLVDRTGNVLAGKNARGTTNFSSRSGYQTIRGTSVFVFDFPLMSPGQQRMGMGGSVAGWHLRLGLYGSDADFIRRQAIVQAATTGVAILLLVVMAYALVRTLRRSLDMQARENSERHLKSLGTMVAVLAHEIRNPLSAMKGLTQLAQEDLSPEHSIQSQLRTVVSEAERLERLVTDLLDFARTKEPQISQFELSELLSELKAMLESRLQTSNVALHLPSAITPMQVRSDPAGLRQILLNVLMNAIDATPEGGTVELTAGRDESDKSIVIRVDDSGKGIGQNNPDELFQPFVTTKVRGTGLGLAVSKQIAEKLGGTLKLENLPGGGARCSITLPIF